MTGCTTASRAEALGYSVPSPPTRAWYAVAVPIWNTQHVDKPATGRSAERCARARSSASSLFNRYKIFCNPFAIYVSLISFISLCSIPILVWNVMHKGYPIRLSELLERT